MVKSIAAATDTLIEKTIHKTTGAIRINETAVISSISAGTAEISGMPHAQMNELILFKNNVIGMVQTLRPEAAGVVFLTNADTLKAGDKARRTRRVLDVPVGEALLGRVINPLGQPLDDKGPVTTKNTLPVERESAPIMHRAPVEVPLQTGIKAIDSFTPIGRGQRELILGDRQTGKTAIALDTIINQKDTGVICIYCAIGQRATGTARVIADLEKYGVTDNTIVVVASGEDTAGMQYIAPYAATSIGEYFMEQGRDVLIVYDDLTAHARAYRQMSLLLRTPPGREAFPGDIFYIHARLLERATHLRPEYGGGSLTALPVVSTEAGNISAYIPTNIISITDGQIYLSTDLYQKGILPAIDTGRSVSRVGGDAQLPAYRSLVGPLKLFFAQFEELESFARFGTQMDAQTQSRLNRGRAIRAVMQQRQYQPMKVADQIAVLTATNAGLLDAVAETDIVRAQNVIVKTFNQQFKPLIKRIVEKRIKPDSETIDKLLTAFNIALQQENIINDIGTVK